MGNSPEVCGANYAALIPEAMADGVAVIIIRRDLSRTVRGVVA